MWWNGIPEEKKNQTKNLIKNGQIEIVNGGWSMTDEACPNYNDMIDNFVIGHKFLKDNFGMKPRIGW